VTPEELRAALGGPLPEQPVDARQVVTELAAAAEPGVVAIGSGRYFGFVIGGSLPAALAADWLTTAWDQNAGLYVGGPSASIVEQVTREWIVDLLGLPANASVGFVTGTQMAHVTGLAAARQPSGSLPPRCVWASNSRTAGSPSTRLRNDGRRSSSAYTRAR
jgi:glutamate/tyrosine decarboxylase-like PLP-dependent enzyme